MVFQSSPSLLIYIHNLFNTSSAQCPFGIALHFISFFFCLLIALVASCYWVHLHQPARNVGGAASGDDHGIDQILKIAKYVLIIFRKQKTIYHLRDLIPDMHACHNALLDQLLSPSDLLTTLTFTALFPLAHFVPPSFWEGESKDKQTSCLQHYTLVYIYQQKFGTERFLTSNERNSAEVWASARVKRLILAYLHQSFSLLCIKYPKRRMRWSFCSIVIE